MSAAICRSSGASHLLLVVNQETAGMYRRLGFKVLAEKFWVEEIGNDVVPLAASTDTFLEWALGSLSDTPLSPFEDSFERQVLREGEVVFDEGDVGDQAYIVESGHIRISRRYDDGQDLVLASLVSGDLFGELALVDNKPRSATATATSDTELVTLSRDAFLRDLKENPHRSQELFKIFADRIRLVDDLAMMMAFAPNDQRLDFAIQAMRRRAIKDRKDPTRRIFRGGCEEFARIAAVEPGDAASYLNKLVESGEIEFTAKTIIFL
ncbi:MAG: CRP/FNR family cyclic AMP-dependent transcriptional regulator [Gammaproteobacteria bacterium]